MPSSLKGGGGGRKRYAATVEKGENAWKREWSSFISGVDMKRVRDGTTSVSLRAKADLAHEAGLRGAEEERASKRESPRISRKASSGTKGKVEEQSAAPGSFSYLFNSPAERRAERNQKKKRIEDAKRRKAVENTVSKHRLALDEAAKRGLTLDGMSRKQVREFLRLTQSKEQEEAQRQARERKLYELMDERLAWYQQGPHPISLIAERLVTRKAAKKGKRLGLVRYNYLLPHPSWLAARTRRRKESVLVGLGKRFTFDEETGQALDPLHGNAPVDLTKVSLLLNGGGGGGGGRGSSGGGGTHFPSNNSEWNALDEEAELATGAAAWRGDGDGDGDGDTPALSGASSEDGGGEGSASDEQGPAARAKAAAVPQALESLLADPTRAFMTFSRAVAKNREAALIIQRANLTTSFLSHHLVKGPSLGLVEEVEGGGGGDREERGRGHRGDAKKTPKPPSHTAPAPSHLPRHPRDKRRPA